MSNYINKAIQFLNDELKAAKKEVWRLKNLPDNAHGDEGDTISGATALSNNQNSTTFSFPNQFTKVKDEQKVILWNGTNEVVDIEVLKVDYLKNNITLTGLYPVGSKFLIILCKIVSPKNIIDSLIKSQDSSNPVIENLINKTPNITVFDKLSDENILKTVDLMNGSVLCFNGPPGTGKSRSLNMIINHLLDQPSAFGGETKNIAICSNSHQAINNLINEISHPKLKGFKIGSQGKYESTNKQFKNGSVSGKEIDRQISGYNVVGATAFAFAKVNEYMFDVIIVDEASQVKMSFLVSLSRIAKNIIVAGDQNQLQSISILPETEGGESVLDFLVGKGCKVIPKSKGYFLDKTYRMNTNIAKIVSDVFYESKLSWVARKDGGTINLIKTPSSRGSKINKAEALEVIKLYKKLIKEKHKPETIAIITPFNAQVNFIKSILHKNKKSKFNKTTVSSADGIQGATVTTALISTVSSGHKKDAILNAFATFPNRLNVSISRAKEAVYIFTNDGLINSKDSSPEFKQVIKMIED